ncbi:DUF3592 domain-containing protein [Aureibaculum conchae]|uniref:DUF3592 domain-containing protein n=1 Tax=Aureibaculum sp. 2308TA14-22 TaxID=3108392 RepID=UPI00339201E3
MSNNLFELTIGAVLILTGIIFLYLLFLSIYINYKINTWNSINGKILVSNLSKKVKRYSIDLDDYGDSTEIAYTNKVIFEFEIENCTYVSDRLYYLNFNKWFLTNKFKKSLAEKYIIGKEVKVYYNPKEIEKAFLVQKTPITILLSYSLLSILGGLFFMFW